MLVGTRGRQGSGKTLTMSAIGLFLANAMKLKLYANYSLFSSIYLPNLQALEYLDTGVVCLDEVWLWLDSRRSSKNIDISPLILQARKKGLLIMWNAQNEGQVDLRLRENTDYMLFMERNRTDRRITLTTVDWQYGDIGRRLEIRKPEVIYDLYDSFEVLKPKILTS